MTPFPELDLPDLAYKEAGQGLPVVLIHGFCERKEIWTGFLQQLSQNFRVITIDLPGFGDNAPQESPLTIGDMADRIYALLTKIGVDHCVMIGHSLGGYVALAYGEKFPFRLKGLGLFHSTSFSDSVEKKQARNKTIDFIDRYGVGEFVQEFVPPLFFDSRRKELKEEIQAVVQMGLTVSKSTVIETIKAMRDRKDRTRVLEKAPYPVLIIAGRNDIAVPFANSQQMFGVPMNATIQVMNNTAHMGMLERPKETLRMIASFLEQVEAADFE